MFNDKYGLTQAVLEGLKTMTRRAFYIPDKLALKYYVETDNLVICETQHNEHIIEWRDNNDNVRMTFRPKYAVGEVVHYLRPFQDVLDSYTPLNDSVEEFTQRLKEMGYDGPFEYREEE